ncbi:MAG: hypothetical protein EBV06_00740 [Planctomycetia bacterium]|nr:hypothetical protein [Planctomycetia bacterium]
MTQSGWSESRIGLLVVLSLGLLTLAGCGGGVPKEKLDAAQQAVTKALDAWKKNEKPVGYMFTDPAHAKRQKLMDYQILRTEADREGVIRTFVKLTLQDARGKQATPQAAYMVKLEPTPVISNDPMF